MRILCTLVVMCICCENTVAAQEAKKKVIVTRFVSPLKDQEWKPNSYQFGQICEYETGKGVLKTWGKHLGEDHNVPAGTKIYAIAAGPVNFADIKPGTSKDNRNWGGVVIVGHWISSSEALYVLYGHIKIKPGLKKGDFIQEGDEIGEVAPGPTTENGWWEDAHLHLQINLDPDAGPQDGILRNGFLSGYEKAEAPHRLKDHIAPSEFFRRFKSGMTIKELMKK